MMQYQLQDDNIDEVQLLVNQMNEWGVETGIDSKEIELPQHIEEQFQSTYVDNRGIKGQSAMNYIMQEQEVEDKLNKAWFHFLVSGEVYTHRGVRNSEPYYEILNPIDVDYDLDPDLDFVEDGDWALVRKYVHASSVIDSYYEYLSETQILELENWTPLEIFLSTIIVLVAIEVFFIKSL